MNTIQLNRKFAAHILCTCSIFLSNAIAQNANEAFPPKFEVGDTWSYQFTDLWKNEIKPSLATESVKTIEKNFIWFEGKNYEDKPFKYRSDLEMNPPHYVYRGEKLFNKIFVWPLAVGKKWNNDRKYGSGDYDMDSREDCEVQSFEKVKVPAGEFEAHKIFCKVRENWYTGKIYRWYSVEAKRVVKTQSEWRTAKGLYSESLIELKSYQVK